MWRMRLLETKTWIFTGLEVSRIGIFFDTGFFFALKFKKDPNHKRALKILQDISEKKYGSQFTSDYIIDELMTLTWKRTKNKQFPSQIWKFFKPATHICNILQISMDDIPLIYDIFYKYLDREKFLSFTDCTILYLMEKFKIHYLASFDANFDGLTTCIVDPL